MDQFGNDMLTGGAHFTAKLDSQPELVFNLTDFNNGTYMFSYLPTVAVDTNIRVQLNGTDIKNSPKDVTIYPGMNTPYLD